MRFALIASILLFAASRGLAFETGSEFLKECEPGTKKAFSELTDQEKQFGGACAIYVRGFVGGIRVAEVRTGTKMVCSPAGVEVLQAMKISVKWMNEHTGDLGSPAVELIFRSLADAFPCPKTAPSQKEEKVKRDSLFDNFRTDVILRAKLSGVSRADGAVIIADVDPS